VAEILRIQNARSIVERGPQDVLTSAAVLGFSARLRSI